MKTSGSLTVLDTPDIVTDINLDNLRSSDGTNLEIIESIFDSKNDDYSTYGYYPQIYSDSLQATYYALSILDFIGKLSEIDQGEVSSYIMSFYNSSSHQFVDSSAKRYLSSEIPILYLPLTTLLEVNCYAVLSLDILNTLSLIDTAEIVDFIWDC
jgi:prenyltransferase beta subunit